MIEFANLSLTFIVMEGPQSLSVCESWIKRFGVRVSVGWRNGGGVFEGCDLVRTLRTAEWSRHISLDDVPPCCLQVAARTGETGVRRRTQAMSRSASKRRSRFSSLWGLDTTSKKKQGRPSINQVGSRVDGKASVDGFCDHLTLGCVCVCVFLRWQWVLFKIS